MGWLGSSGKARRGCLEAAQLRGGGVCDVERQQAAIVTKPNAASGDYDEAGRSKPDDQSCKRGRDRCVVFVCVRMVVAGNGGLEGCGVAGVEW